MGLRVVQFGPSRSSDFVITRMITDRIGLSRITITYQSVNTCSLFVQIFLYLPVISKNQACTKVMLNNKFTNGDPYSAYSQTFYS